MAAVYVSLLLSLLSERGGGERKIGREREGAGQSERGGWGEGERETHTHKQREREIDCL